MTEQYPFQVEIDVTVTLSFKLQSNIDSKEANILNDRILSRIMKGL